MADIFGNVKKQPGLLAWRVEQFKLVALPKLGDKLYTGDSYVVLNSYKDANGSVKHNIHFWLGAETSQFREVQGSESPEFLKLFTRLTILPGGKASGFAAVPATATAPKLIQVHQTAGAVRVAPVPCSLTSLNSGDAFILDVGETVYLWQGSNASPKEKSRALDVATGIRDEDHAGSAKVVVLEEKDRKSPEAIAFYAALGVQDPAAATITTADEAADTAALFEPPQLFKVDGSAFTPVAQDPLSKSLLISEGVFLLRTGGSVWVWLGSKVPAATKSEAAKTAAAFLTAQGLPAGTPVKISKERLEPTMFKLSFPDWPSDELAAFVHNTKAPTEERNPEQQQQQALASLLAPQSAEAESSMFGSNGKVKMWVVVESKLQEVGAEQVGHLQADKAYVIVYTYPAAQGEAAVVYFWIGRRANNEDAGVAALMATEKHNKDYKGASTLVRVPQGAEPGHLARALGGVLVVYSGAADAGPPRLYQVKGENSAAMEAAEVPASASSLNSGDCFILVAADSSYLWKGSCSLAEEQEAAARLAKAVVGSGSAEPTSEGEEPEEFWEALGGKAEYPRFKVSSSPTVAPRLFELTLGARGAVGVQHIPNFSQDDLSDDDVMLLDTFNQLFLWLGAGSPAEERAASADLAAKYLAAASKVDGRSQDIPITQIESGQEPPLFTCHFQGWDAKRKPKFTDPYENKLAALAKAQEEVEEKVDPAIAARAAAQAKAVAALEAAEAAQAEKLAAAKDDEPPAFSPPKLAKAPVTKAANGEAAGNGHATAALEEEPEAAAVSVKELRRRLSQKSLTDDTPPKAYSRTGSLTGKDRTAAVAEVVKEAEPAPPASHSEHDTKNTTNAAQILEEGTFKLMPLVAVVGYEELVRMRLEDGIDATRKEDYLAEEEFVTVFGLGRADFKKLPAWKQQQAKKKHNLF